MDITGDGKHQRIQTGILDRNEGIDFVPCRVCGKHLSLISGKHLLTHGTDRETYILEYRLSLDQLCSKWFRLNHSSRRDYCPYNKREWIAALKKFYKQHGHTYAGDLQKRYPHLYQQGVWLFGNWSTALHAAGFTAERMRLWAYWDDDRVIRQIQLLRQNSIPLYPAYVLRHYQKLFSAARRRYGSWPNALVAAGIEVPDNPHDGRRGVLRVLREGLEQHSENDLPEKLKLHAAYYFGSLRKAKAALKTDRRFLAGWSKAKVLADIIQMHRSGQPLGYAAARRNNPRLLSAAEAYFGTWGNAIHAAGIDPNLYFRRKWRKRSMTAKRDRLNYGNLFNPTLPAL
jgi:hypothetical protein